MLFQLTVDLGLQAKQSNFMISYLIPIGARSEYERTPDLLVYLKILMSGRSGLASCPEETLVNTVGSLRAPACAVQSINALTEIASNPVFTLFDLFFIARGIVAQLPTWDTVLWTRKSYRKSYLYMAGEIANIGYGCMPATSALQYPGD
jgi:hypothetical protein